MYTPEERAELLKNGVAAARYFSIILGESTVHSAYETEAKAIMMNKIWCHCRPMKKRGSQPFLLIEVVTTSCQDIPPELDNTWVKAS